MSVETIESLRAENARLRTVLADCATHVGAVASPICSLEFLECVSQEVRLVTERLRRERAEALQETERVREQRNRANLEANRTWMSRLTLVAKDRDHWQANQDRIANTARFLIERPDIPLERVRAFNEMTALQQLEEAIRHDREMWEGTSDEANPMGTLVTDALNRLDAVRAKGNLK